MNVPGKAVAAVPASSVKAVAAMANVAPVPVPSPIVAKKSQTVLKWCNKRHVSHLLPDVVYVVDLRVVKAEVRGNITIFNC